MWSFKKKETGNVIGLSCKPYFRDYIPVLKRLQQYFEQHYGLRLEYVTYANRENKDVKGKLSTFSQVSYGDVSLLRIDTKQRMDDEKELCAGFFESNNEVLIYIMIHSRFPVHFRDVISILEAGNNINYGFLYQVAIGEEPFSGYLLESTSAAKSVINLPRKRLTKDLMFSMRKNGHLLMKGIMKDVFSENLVTDLHLDNLKGTRFLEFIKEQSAIETLSEGVYIIRFRNEKMLDQARVLAYKEKLVIS